METQPRAGMKEMGQEAFLSDSQAKYPAPGHLDELPGDT